MKWYKNKRITILFAFLAVAIILVAGVSTINLSVVSASSLHVEGNKIYNGSGQEVLLRGVGMAGFAPSIIFWGTGEGDAWSHQWTPATDSDVTQTFQQLRDVWNVNMIRFFFYPEWWWLDNVNPYVASGVGYPNTDVSTRDYIKNLATVAASYGICLDLVPYQLTAQIGAYASDPYLSNGGGLPMMGSWDSFQQSFINDQGYGSEQAFWTAFYTAMGNDLKGYSNVIFEAWNEPNLGGVSHSVVPSGYLTYLTTMYSAIRGTGATNLIMYQWEMGWMPNGWGMDLHWAGQIASAIGNPSNVVYTTHFYYYAPSDITRYWNQGEISASSGGVPYTVSQLEAKFQTLIGTMGVTAPLVINEEGSCRGVSSDVNKDVVWWGNVLQAQANSGMGMCAYMWLSDSGLGGTFSGMGQISSGYTPNTMGQEFIDVFGSSPAPSSTPTPSATPTPSGGGSSGGDSTPTPNPDGSTPAPSSEPNQNGEEKPWYQFILDFLNWLGELFT